MRNLVEIADIIKGKEGKKLEFKRDLSSFKPIMRTLIAFANTAGGTLVIGRDDSGHIIGIEDVLQAEESIANAVADSIMPAMMPDIEIITYETKDLLIVRAAHWSGPFYLKNEGPDEGVGWWLGPQTSEEGSGIAGVAFDLDLDASRGIADPAGEVESLSEAIDEGAKADALHRAAHLDATAVATFTLRLQCF